ncbi:alpha/beta hydrolase [Xanthobacter agilis]|uniref:Esterase/lipase superfamily enzyme n=1 Tax=Xanthobacter agilis TaxID=47492 RepID=A0ABU0LBX3_XANAG|nr:alpha/beta hydrolase [Xanthobacter agilis]MDQ0504635.1 esterase/lipase superfamily enzyme [Xanthobacter agilis]
MTRSSGTLTFRAARMLALVAACAASMSLTGCARPEGVLIPVAVGAEVAADKVDMLVATTRAPSETAGVVFSGERGDSLSFANIVVSIPPNRATGSIQWPAQVPGDPARDFVVTQVDPLSRQQVLPWFQKLPGNKRRVLVFVHGFNTPFDAAVFRFAQFIHDTRSNLVPVLFSWPSRGRVTSYVYDRESTNFSRSDLAYVLAAAARSPHVDEVVVLAHSMGAWLAVEALRQLALQDGRIPPKITNVILASPDLDIDVFERQVQEMGPKRPTMTIFVSRNDHALSLSRTLAGDVQRVGAVDLTNPAYAARLEQGDGVTVLDLTALQGGDALNHSKFATQPDMVRLIGDQLVAGQPISDGASGAAGAVDVVGGAVGAVVTAPIQVFRADVAQSTH